MADVTTGVEDKVKRGYRLIQIPRSSVVALYDGEVTDENASEFQVMFVYTDLHQQVLSFFESQDPDAAGNMTFNDMIWNLFHAARAAAAVEAADAPA